MNSLSLLLWIDRLFMNKPTDFNPLHDFALADCEVQPEQVDNAFRSLPWCRRLFIKGKEPISRVTWRMEKKEVKK